ncbi:MAG: (d)CMP kinase [bacterium]|nr:(d)CMP kinase [bacterium]
MSPKHIAIDGPVAGGKSTVALMVARRLNLLYVDTGAMYRAVALAALRDGVELDDGEGLAAIPRRHRIDLEPAGDARGYSVHLDGADVTAQLFQSAVTAAVSTVAAHPEVRRVLVERQREIARQRAVVMAGRDIGTVVLPEARVKVFLTASVDERVRRRLEELRAAGSTIDTATLRAEVERRDHTDSTRSDSPLRPAAGALVLDSSELRAEEVVARIVEFAAGVDRAQA